MNLIVRRINEQKYDVAMSAPITASSTDKTETKIAVSHWKASSTNCVPGSIKPVYGAQHPPLQQTPKSCSNFVKKEDKMLKTNKKDAFHDFENNTWDAWDDGDDDLISRANIQMSLREVQSSAKAVLDNHSKNLSKQKEQELLENISDGSGQGSSHSHGMGPGVGVRLNKSWRPPKVTTLRFAKSSVSDRDQAKSAKMKIVLDGPTDLGELRKLAWSGTPKSLRPITWKILSGYLPASIERREPTLSRKRNEYFSFVAQYYDSRLDMHEETFRQILKDIPRMTTLVHLLHQEVVQNIFERILFIWALRHPASGYVQGINDLVTPFFVVFLTEYIANDIELEKCNLSELPDETLNIIEADSFWCFSKLLDGIQDNYTFAQPGIQCKVNALKELIKRIDAPLHSHLEKLNVEYLQFSFRWMNNLLMREIPLMCTVRLWDTYLCEENGFADFHLYCCAAFLIRFEKDIMREKEFQGALMLLQNLPTHHWHNEEIGELLAEAYKLKYMFADAPNHLPQKKT